MRKLRRILRPLKDLARRQCAARSGGDPRHCAGGLCWPAPRPVPSSNSSAKAGSSCCGSCSSWEHGIPSHDTFSNVLRVLDPKGLEAVLRKFSKSFGVKGVVSIDGKALRGAFTRGRQAAPLHMVNVWAAGTRMALAQRKAPNRNEVAGALEVLALLDLEGAVVTADALHCRPDTAQAIRDRKGHYVFAIKSNRGRLFKAVKALLDTARKPARANQRRTSAHGRLERRQAIVAPAPQLAKQYGFPAIAAVGRIDSWRANAGKTAKHTARYFLASRLLSAKKLLEVVRAHWGIENNLHWVLDVLVRRGRLPQPQGPCRRKSRRHPQARHQCPAGDARSRPHQSQNVPGSDGTTTSFSPSSPICDSPTLQGRVKQVTGRLRKARRLVR